MKQTTLTLLSIDINQNQPRHPVVLNKGENNAPELNQKAPGYRTLRRHPGALGSLSLNPLVSCQNINCSLLDRNHNQVSARKQLQ